MKRTKKKKKKKKLNAHIQTQRHTYCAHRDPIRTKQETIMYKQTDL